MLDLNIRDIDEFPYAYAAVSTHLSIAHTFASFKTNILANKNVVEDLFKNLQKVGYNVAIHDNNIITVSYNETTQEENTMKKEPTYYTVYLGYHFGNDIDAYRAAIDSAVDYAWKNGLDEVHIDVEYPDPIKELGYKFSKIQNSYGKPTTFVLPLKSVKDIQVAKVLPNADELGKRSESEADMLIMAYIAEKITEADKNGWRDVFIPHAVPTNVLGILKENNYRITAITESGVLISWKGGSNK